MSHHPLGRALTDKQNALHVFCKHFKSIDKACTTDRSMPHCCSSNHTKYMELQHSQLNKTKRLKTRKERSQVKGGGSKSKFHRQHQGGKNKEHTQGCCQSSSRPCLQRGVPFACIFPADQEPSIITDNRLIGHHGLFNHEVKSIDIERLLSKQRKLEKLGHFRVHCKETASLPTCPPAFLPLSTPKPVVDESVGDFADNIEDASDECKAKRSKSTMKSHKCEDCECNSERRPSKCSHGDSQDGVEKNTSIACYFNRQESGITQQTQQSVMTSSESEVVNLLSTESSSCVVEIKSRMPRPIVLETDRESLLSPCGKNENERTPDTRFNQKMVITSDQTPEKHVLPSTQPQGPSPRITELSSSAVSGGNEGSDHQIQQTDPNRISAVAVRLCGSLQFPLLQRRQLVEESREVLLQTLRERHGHKLQENLLKVQRHLSFGIGTITRTGQGQSITPNAVWTAALLDGICGESMPEQLFQNSAPHKRSRKQLCPVRVTPPLPLHWPEYSLDTAPAWTPCMEQVEELNRKIQRAPSSSHFLMKLQHSSSSSPNHIFVPTSASCWAAQSSPTLPSPTLPWDNNFNRDIMRESNRVDHFESWRYDPDVSFLNQAETGKEGRSRPQCEEWRGQPFLQYSTGQTETNKKIVPKQQDLYDNGMRCVGASFSPDPTYSPLDSHQLQPFYRFNCPSTSPRSQLSNMACYPPSHMVESGLSDTLPPGPMFAFPSPECWSFPRMRLY